MSDMLRQNMELACKSMKLSLATKELPRIKHLCSHVEDCNCPNKLVIKIVKVVNDDGFKNQFLLLKVSS